TVLPARGQSWTREATCLAIQPRPVSPAGESRGRPGASCSPRIVWARWSHLSSRDAHQTAPAQRQNPGQCAREEHLTDVHEEVEPVYCQLAAEQDRRDADQDAAGGENPSSKSTRGEIRDHETQDDPRADWEDLLHGTLLMQRVRVAPLRATLAVGFEGVNRTSGPPAPFRPIAAPHGPGL